MPRRRRHVFPGAEEALDRYKHEVAGDLGLEDDIRERGWENMTTREAGKVGGNMVRRMIERAERDMAGERFDRTGGAAGRVGAYRDYDGLGGYDEEFGTEWAGYPEVARREAELDRPRYDRRRERDRGYFRRRYRYRPEHDR